jgi:hypothetical protein
MEKHAAGSRVVTMMQSALVCAKQFVTDGGCCGAENSRYRADNIAEHDGEWR